MVKTVSVVVPQCTFLISTSSKGFNTQVVETSVICRFCIHNHLTWMMFSVRRNIDSWQCVVEVAD